jgi:hypothetical protein
MDIFSWNAGNLLEKLVVSQFSSQQDTGLEFNGKKSTWRFMICSSYKSSLILFEVEFISEGIFLLHTSKN